MYRVAMFRRPIPFGRDKMIALLTLRMLLRIHTDPLVVLHFGKNGGRCNGQIGPVSLHDHMLLPRPIIYRKGPVNQQTMGVWLPFYSMNSPTKRLTIRPGDPVPIDFFRRYHADGASVPEKVTELRGEHLSFLRTNLLGIPYRKKDGVVFVRPFGEGRETHGPCRQRPPEGSSSGLIHTNFGSFIFLIACCQHDTFIFIYVVIPCQILWTTG